MQLFLGWTHDEHTANIKCKIGRNKFATCVHPLYWSIMLLRLLHTTVSVVDTCWTNRQHCTNTGRNKFAAGVHPLYWSIILFRDCCTQQFLWLTHVGLTSNIVHNTGRNKFVACIHPLYNSIIKCCARQFPFHIPLHHSISGIYLITFRTLQGLAPDYLTN